MKKLTPNKVNETTGPVCRVEKAPSAPAPADEGLISKHEVARRLHVTVRTVERWQRRGLIPYSKCGHLVYYNWPAVLAHVHSNLCVPPTPTERLLRIPVVGIAGDPAPKETK